MTRTGSRTLPAIPRGHASGARSAPLPALGLSEQPRSAPLHARFSRCRGSAGRAAAEGGEKRGAELRSHGAGRPPFPPPPFPAPPLGNLCPAFIASLTFAIEMQAKSKQTGERLPAVCKQRGRHLPASPASERGRGRGPEAASPVEAEGLGNC